MKVIVGLRGAHRLCVCVRWRRAVTTAGGSVTVTLSVNVSNQGLVDAGDRFFFLELALIGERSLSSVQVLHWELSTSVRWYSPHGGRAALDIEFVHPSQSSTHL